MVPRIPEIDLINVKVLKFVVKNNNYCAIANGIGYASHLFVIFAAMKKVLCLLICCLIFFE